MLVLVVNSGSSSLKYQLFKMPAGEVIAKGLIEKIGLEGPLFNYKTSSVDKKKVECDVKNHFEAVQLMLKTLLDKEIGVLKDVSEINAIGHRIVHGGERFVDSVMIDEDVLNEIRKLVSLAPLHNPAGILGIEACQKLLPEVPEVAVFDTSFHQHMPPEAYLYGIPYEMYEKRGYRRYGFHGTSHRYVSKRVAQLIGKPLEDLKIISCHIGNGASVAAVKNKYSVDTSMGLTPLEGLVMGTRCGDIDPALIIKIMEEDNLTPAQASDFFNKKCGVLGLSGLSSDMRVVEEAWAHGNKQAKLAYDVYAYRIKKYIGAYMAVMNGLDVIVFTAGVGENDWLLRQLACSNLEHLGIELDLEKNREFNRREGKISTDTSKVAIYIVPTNEELMIAHDTMNIVEMSNKTKE